MGYSTMTFGGETLIITNITPRKEQKTIKQVSGKSLIETRIVGLNTQQWRFDVTGLITGATTGVVDTNRTNLQALDDCDTHALVDGIHDGSYYIIPGSLQFTDDQSIAGGTHYKYTMTLVES